MIEEPVVRVIPRAKRPKDGLRIQPRLPYRLKPCPFCGSYKVHLRSFVEVPLYYVECFECGVLGQQFSKSMPAIEAWNTRTHFGGPLSERATGTKAWSAEEA